MLICRQLLEHTMRSSASKSLHTLAFLSRTYLLCSSVTDSVHVLIYSSFLSEAVFDCHPPTITLSYFYALLTTHIAFVTLTKICAIDLSIYIPQYTIGILNY